MTTAGRNGGLSASGRDIAARVLAGSPDGMIVIDDRDLVVARNQTAEAIRPDLPVSVSCRRSSGGGT